MMTKFRRCFPSLSRFGGDDRGTISVEFVVVIPLLVLWLVASFIFFDAFKSNSRTEKVAYTISDIMSRHDAVDETDMAYLNSLMNKMLPARLDNRILRVSSICFEDDQYRVLWSYVAHGNDIEEFEELTDLTIPLRDMPVMADQDSVILTEVKARWKPLTGMAGLQEQVWVNALTTRPRFVQIITHETRNNSPTCPNSGA